MDRRNFINKECLNNINTPDGNACGTEVCECDEASLLKKRQQSGKIKSSHLVTIAMMALLCAIVLTEFKSNAAKTEVNEWLLAKYSKTISCGSNEKLNSNDRSIHQDWPENKNNGNGCSHQQGFLCETNNSKRKLLKTFNC